LRQILSNLRVDSAVVVGFTTSGCVRATAVDALQSNFRLIVVREACGDRDIQAHDANLRDLQLKYGDVVSLESALQMIGDLPC
jgi:nicotinamidase-related amidase